MNRRCLAAFLAAALIVAFASDVRAQTASPEDILKLYVADLRKNQNDYALREKIIKHAQTMSPTPRIPSEVDELVGQAKYVFKHAKAQKDYLDAIEAYKKVTDLAPWVGDYYFNLGVAQEQAGQPQEAIRSFNLYLMASPDAKDAREVRERIGGLKYAMEKARKEQQATEVQARAEQEQREAPKRFLKQVKSLYEGKSFKWLQCSHTGTYQVCFDEAGVWPCGCNEAEMSGNTWYDTKGNVRISFPDDSTILFTSSGGSNAILLRGNAKGSRAEDITWESPEPDSRKANKWKPVWVRIAQCGSYVGPLDCLYYSTPYYDFPGTKPPSRPVNSSEYNPYMRYEYYHLKLR